MFRKMHLTQNGGVTCQKGMMGAGLRGEFIGCGYEEFKTYPEIQRCNKCNSGKLFAFLNKQAAKKAANVEVDFGDWEPADDPNAWKAADDALIAAKRK